MSVEFNAEDKQMLRQKLGDTGEKLFQVLSAVSVGIDVDAVLNARAELKLAEAQQDEADEALLSDAMTSFSDTDTVDRDAE